MAPDTPSNDSLTYVYRSNGLVQAIKPPGDTLGVRFLYDSTDSWNLLRAIDPSQDTLTINDFDDVGRLTTADRKLRVEVAGGTTTWQWRRALTYYNVANQVDSTREMHTADCSDPCNTPTWPEATDSLRNFRWAWRFDRAGRDSLLLNNRAKATMYVYDRLGRVMSRRPWTDSMAVKDTFAYDVVGNLKKIITRRGDTLTTNFDTRNRDTLTAIPGVGTLRRAFAGALDQVSRVWYDSYVDSIGNVNPAVAWVYDQSGRLLRDTSFTGGTARTNAYTYDSHERVATLTDASGQWTLGYEADRSFLTSIKTPLGDTLSYTYDQRGRPSGPVVTSGGQRLTRTPTFNVAGALQTLTTTVQVGTPWTAGKQDRLVTQTDANPVLTPVWTEKHGSAAAVDSLKDVVGYDGWGRLNSWEGVKNGTAVATQDHYFDPAANLSISTLQDTTDVFDATTNRLTKRVKGSWSASYQYDRAGNLVTRIDSAPGSVVTWTYAYDALNQLRGAWRNGTLIARYAYDVLGRRISKRVYSSASGGNVGNRRFAYRGDHVSFETDSAGTIKTRYTWGPGVDDLVAIRDSAEQTFYTVTDKLGSVRGLVRRDGAWIRSLWYDPYGSLRAHDSSATNTSGELRYRWTGREYDAETGLYFFRARYYDPAVGRFVQEDPIGYAGGSSLYGYVQGRVLEARDPTGLDLCVNAKPWWEVTTYANDHQVWRFLGWEIVGVPYQCGEGNGSPAGGGGGGGSAAPAANQAQPALCRKATLAGDITVSPSIADDAAAFLNWAVELGADVRITSSFRPTVLLPGFGQSQTELWDDRKTNPYPVDRPNTSTHEAGFAIDVSWRNIDDRSRNLIRSVAERFGFNTSGRDPVHFVHSTAPAMGESRRAVIRAAQSAAERGAVPACAGGT